MTIRIKYYQITFIFFHTVATPLVATYFIKIVPVFADVTSTPFRNRKTFSSVHQTSSFTAWLLAFPAVRPLFVHPGRKRRVSTAVAAAATATPPPRISRATCPRAAPSHPKQQHQHHQQGEGLRKSSTQPVRRPPGASTKMGKRNSKLKQDTIDRLTTATYCKLELLLFF